MEKNKSNSSLLIVVGVLILLVAAFLVLLCMNRNTEEISSNNGSNSSSNTNNDGSGSTTNEVLDLDKLSTLIKEHKSISVKGNGKMCIMWKKIPLKNKKKNVKCIIRTENV